MAIKFIEVTDDEIIGLETREIRMPIEKLITYVLENNGFEHEGVSYFTTTLMPHKYSDLFEQSGLIKKLGTLNQLRNKNILPCLEQYGGHGLTKIYRINSSKLNKRISKRRQNGKTAEN